MRTDLKINFDMLEAIEERIITCYNATENLMDNIEAMKDVLGEQESETIDKLKEKIDTLDLELDNRKEKLSSLKTILRSYIDDMSALVAPVDSSVMSRVDTLDTSWNISQIESEVSAVKYDLSLSTPSSFYFAFTDEDKDEEEKRKRNYDKVNNFRSGTIMSLMTTIADKVADIKDIYTNYLKEYETTDDNFRSQLNGIYDTLTSDSDKSSNNWNFFAKVSEAFIKAFVVAAAIALAVVLLPGVVVAGIAVTLAVGCVVMTAVPEEKVPSWLQGARDTGDKLLNDPLSIIGDMGQGFMDQIQTPEGIATAAGEFTGGLAGGAFGMKVKPKVYAKVNDMRFGRSNKVNNLKYYEDPYLGVREASEYLKSQNVPRQYRKQILESFQKGTIKMKTAGKNTYGLRFYGGNANIEGRYLFETFTPTVNRSGLALPYEWNSMSGIQQFQIRSGTTMITGKVAAQSSFGPQYAGGCNQWYINSLEDIIKCN